MASFDNNQVLSQGLDALFNTKSKIEEGQLSKDDDGSLLKALSVNQLRPGKYQPRKVFPEQSISELAASIAEQGILQPLIVRAINEEGMFEIIAGERRWRAAQRAGLEEVPTVIRNVDDSVALAYSLIENIQRKDLTPIEEAKAFLRLIDEFSMTHDEVGLSVGRSRVSITNLLRLLTLSENVQSMIENNSLSMGHAKVLLALSPDEQEIAAREVTLKQLSVRETEFLVKKMLDRSWSEGSVLQNKFVDPRISRWQERLCSIFDAGVDISINKNGKSKLTITFDSPEKLEELVEGINVTED